MRILITGVAGHIGSAVAKYIRATQPHARIIGVDDLSSGYVENVPHGVQWYKAKVSELAGGDRFDLIFHFASFAAEVYSHECRCYTIERVWRETASLINAVQRSGGCGRFVFASSIAVYGKMQAPFSESTAPMPNDPYGIAKLACENDLRCSGLPFTILRPHNVYGPNQNLWDTQRNVFGKWMRAALDGEQAMIYGDGLQQRAFTYIDDVLPLIWQSSILQGACGETLNIGSDTPVTLLGAWKVFSEVTEYRNYLHAPARNEAQISFADGSKCQRLLGKMEETALNKGIAEMWKWAKLQGKREFVKVPCKEN
jgi:UDP-glucose 4-epimerase